MSEALEIGYFLEDIGHASFISALVERVANDLQMPVHHYVHNATGGKGCVMTELRHYLSDASRGRVTVYPILVVAIDGNCSTYQGKMREILGIRARTGYPGVLVCAIPDPHIECWYLADLQAFRRAVPGSHPKVLSSVKRERDHYKKALLDAFATAGFRPQLGGAEYAKDIVSHMVLQRAAQNDPALNRFLRDLNSALKQYAHRG